MASDRVARELGRWFRGELILPDDARFDGARAVWNGAVDRRPAAIARCASTAHVIAALRVTRELGLEVAVRGGGHSLAGYGVADGAVTIDLSPMRSVRVDAGKRRATVEAGCLLSDLDKETQRYGLAVPSGLVSHTGVAGLTLGGGVGWLSRKHGLACDNLLAAQVVTANGDIVVASEERDPELLWALRGGGGNFGVVTSFEFQLHEAGPIVSSGAGFYAIQDGPAVLDTFGALAAEASEETTWIASIWNAEAGSFLPASCHTKPVVALVFVHVGSPEEGLALARHLRQVARPLAEVVGPVPYTELQASNDGGWRHGLRRYWKSHYLWDLPPAAIEVFLRRGSSSSGGSEAVSGSLQALGGAIGRVPDESTAVGHRGAAFDFMSTTTWTDPTDDDVRRVEARRFADAMAPFARGVYVNNLGTEGEERVLAAFGAKKYEQLAVLKRRYDPENVFHLNQNIKPAPG
ncbi:MAG TPA: FAD-binding oxidoreductase [Acidimicrobiales bacterium]|nr:FAD-binding oxidoreductase [Acidimicrobiales bacterium]